MSASLACLDTDVSVSKATEYTVTTLFCISSQSQPKFTKSAWYLVKPDAAFSTLNYRFREIPCWNNTWGKVQTQSLLDPTVNLSKLTAKSFHLGNDPLLHFPVGGHPSGCSYSLLATHSIHLFSPTADMFYSKSRHLVQQQTGYGGTC